MIIKAMDIYSDVPIHDLNYNTKVDCLKFKQIKPPIFQTA